MKTIPLWLRIVVGLALALGILLRFTNLNNKIFWLDEVSTAWAISGYSAQEVADSVATGRRLHAADVLRYQQGAVDRNWLVTVRVLATSDAAHPPLYYLIVRTWRELFGSSVGVTRSISALISVFALICVYFLCVELFGSALFGSALVGWVAAGLVALSPFQLYYAQEAREYALLTLLTLLSSLALLWAQRLQSSGLWILYAASVVAGLYTSLLFLTIVVVHALYIFATSTRSRDLTVVRNAVSCLVLGIVAFAPWLSTVVTHRQEVAGELAWFTARVTPVSYVAQAIVQVGRLFLWMPTSLRHFIVVGIVLFALVVYSLQLLMRQGPPKARIFIALLIVVPTLPLLASDLIHGGSRLLIGRYVELAFLGFEISVAYLLAYHLGAAKIGAGASRLWQSGFAVLLLCGAISCVKESSYPTAWDSERNAYVIRFAPMLNGAADALLVSDVYQRNVRDVSVLSHSLQPQVAIEIVKDPQPLAIAGYRHVFALNPSRQLMDDLRGYRRYEPRPVDVEFPIFELEPTADGASPVR